MLTLIDGIVVIGGGLAASWKFFSPAMFAEINRLFETPSGEKYTRVSGKVYDLENAAIFGEFANGSVRSLGIPGSDRIVTYDELQRTGVGLSKLSASAAIAIGANAFAVQQLNADGINA
jgi:glucokinase